MYRVYVHDYFSSAHQLKGYLGKCEEIHGHNWKVEVEIEGEKLDDVGLLIDFRILKEILKEILDELDHKMLNEIGEFKETNPSSEHIARYIFHRVKKRLPVGVVIHSVSVWESENARATYLE